MNIGELIATLRVDDRDYNSKVDGAGRRFTRLGGTLQRGAAAAWDAVRTLGTGIANVTTRAVMPAVNAAGRFRDGWNSAAVAASAFSGRMGTLGGVAQRVLGPAVNGVGRFRDGFRNADVAASAFSGRMGTLGGVTQTVFGPGINALGRFRDGFVSTTAAASSFSGRMGTLGGVARSALGGVGTAARGVGSALSTVGSAGVSAGRMIGSGLAAAGSAAVGMGSRFVSAVQNSRSATDGLMGSVKGLAGQLTAFAGIAGIVKIGSDVVGLANQLDNTRRVMDGLYGDTKVAGDMMDRLSRLSSQSSLGHENFLAAGESLAYLGISGDRAEKMLRNLDAATTVAGSGAQGMQSAMYALTGATNSGRVQLDHLNQISHAGVPIFNQLQNQLGVTEVELRKMASEGKIAVSDLEEAFETASGPLWSDMVDASGNASESLTNQWATFRGNFVSGMAQSVLPLVQRAGGAFVGLNAQVTPFFQSIPDLVGKAKAAMDQWGVTDALRNIAEQMGTIARIVGPLLTGVIIGVGAAFGALIHAVSAVLTVIAPLTEYLAENEGLVRGFGIAIGVLTGLFLGGQAAMMVWRGALMLLRPAFTIIQAAMLVLRSQIVATVATAVARWTWLAIKATASAVKTGAAWLLTAGWRAAVAVAQTTAAVVAQLAQWAWLAITATAHAIKVGAAWLLTAGWRAAKAVAQTTAAVVAKLAQWALLAAQATLHAVRVGAAWLLTAGVNAVVAVAQTTAAVVTKIAQWALLAAQAMVNAARVGAAWLLTAGVNATIAVAQTTAAVVAKLAQWALLATQAMVNAARVGAAWLLTAGANAAVAVAQTTMIVARFLAQWALLAVQSMVNAARVAAAWLLTTGAAAATAAAQMAMIAVRFVAQWVLMSAQAMARAAIMAAAWIVAMGPIGWVIAAVVGLVVLIIANWDRVKAFTQAAWSAVTTFISNAWSNIVSTVTSWAQRAVAFVQNAWERAKSITSSAWSSLVSTIASWIARAITWVAGIPGRVVSALGNIGSLLLASGRALVEGFLSGIRNTWDRVVNFVKDGVQRIRNLLPFSPAKEGPLSGSGYVTHSGKALTSDFAKSLRGGMPNIIATARDIVDAAHGQLNRDLSVNGMSLTSGSGLPGQAWLSRARDDDRRRDQPEPGRGGDTILNIHNPAAERASDAINRSKRSLARLGKAR